MHSELLKKEKFLQLILDHIPSYVFWKDRNRNYLGCNLLFAKSAGFASPDEIVGKSDYDLPWGKTDAAFYRKIDKEVMDSGESQINFEEPQTINEGETKWLRTSKIPLYDKEGNVIGILGSYEDITARKNMELELIDNNNNLEKLNKRLEMVNVDLEQFAYSTSHDLQEPLRMIGRFTGLINRKYGDALGEEGKEYLDYIKEGTERMTTLISQILTYSKVDKLEKTYTDVDFSTILGDVIKDLTWQIEEKKAKLKINIPTQSIKCQPGRIRMLFSNLISNAAKFNTSDAPVVSINFEEQEDQWYFTVKDNGIGIEKEYGHQVFKPFKRLNSRYEFQGNGIGLSICKRIIYLHGGEIWYTSNEENGTTFHFTISKKLN